jgi:hypothetical protein
MQDRRGSPESGARGSLTRTNPEPRNATSFVAPGGIPSRRRTLVSLLMCAIMVGSALFFVSPALVAGAPASTAWPAPHSGLAWSAPPSAAPALPTSAGITIPGSNPALDTPISAATIHMVLPIRNPNANLSQLGSLTPPSSPNLPAPSHPAPPGSKLTATVDGTLQNALPPHSPISGAQVEIQPIGGDCQNSSCPPVTSQSNGYFLATILQGNDELIIVAGEYVTNYTIVTNITAGGSYHLGTLYMIPDAHVAGYVYSFAQHTKALSNIGVQGTSRDGKVQALPSAITSGSGYYNTTVPPGPSILLFSPVGRQGIYLPTSRFVDLPPGGFVLLNATYLLQGVSIEVHAYNSESKAQTIDGNDYWAIQACERTSPAVCFPQGTAVSGGSPAFAVGFPGSDFVKVEAAPGPGGAGTPYLTNDTYLNVPAVSGTKTADLGKVFLVPLPTLSLSSTFSFGGSKNGAFKKWGAGQTTLSACSLDGLQQGNLVPNSYFGYNLSFSGCAGGCSPGYPFTGLSLPIFPLRDSVVIKPDTTGVCNPFGGPTWPIPGMTPVTDNFTEVNGTVGLLTGGGWLNLTTGNYVQGEVIPVGTTAGTAASYVPWSVAAITTDEPTSDLNFGAALNNTAETTMRYGYAIQDDLPSGCLASGNQEQDTFCVPVPPGPFKIQVTSTAFLTNQTTAYSAPGIYGTLPVPLATADPLGISVIHIERGLIHGKALGAGFDGSAPSQLPGFPSVTVRPAGLAPWSADSGQLNQTGTYAISAPPGWDIVTVSATDYEPNSTWVYVNATGFTNVPTIYLTPFAILTGRVVGPNGNFVNTTSVTVCLITNPSLSGCTNVFGNGGLSNTNGTYWEFLVGGHIPIGEYEIKASAPGYIENETWANVSYPGGVFTASTIVLDPITHPINAPNAQSGGGTTPPLGSEWVYGTMIDNASGIPLPNTIVTVVPVGGGSPFGIASFNISGDGEFNFSLGIGSYWIWFNDSGFYYPFSTFVKVDGFSSAIDLGTVRLVPFGFLTGQVVVDPWRSHVSFTQGLGAQATVEVCQPLAHVGELCGGAATTDLSGRFNVSGPLGNVSISVIGKGGGLFTGPQGFISNQTHVIIGTDGYVANGSQTQPTRGELAIGLVIFSTFAGIVLDNSTNNTAPVRFAPASIATFTPGSGACNVGGETNGGGIFFALCSAGNVTAGKACGIAFECAKINYTYPNSFYPNGRYNLSYLENVTSGGLTILPTSSLDHFGWIAFYVNATVLPYGSSSLRVAGVAGSASVTNASGVNYASQPSPSDGNGFVNMTAPPGGNVSLFFGGGADFNATLLKNISVNESRTTFINGSSYSHLGNISIVPWSWMNGTVWDPAVNQSIAGAQITAQDSSGLSNAAPIASNGAGYFFSDAPPGDGKLHKVLVTFTAPGYFANNTNISVTPGNLTDTPQVNLKGYGVIAGTVRGLPGDIPLYGAIVTVCNFQQPVCNNPPTLTNGTGNFWVAAPPGIDVVNVTLAGYASNTTIRLSVKSDEFIQIGTLFLAQYATVAGTVLGTPTGHTIAGANVSICSTLAAPGSPTGPCFVTVKSQADGSFAISTEPGRFILAVNFTGYNSTYVTLVLTPGEYLNLGVLFLWQFGTVAGTVLGADTNLPISNASVQACPLWSAGNCTPFELTSPSGEFHLTAPSGEYLLSATARGYLTVYENVLVVSGAVTSVLPIFLIPEATNIIYSISGTVSGGTGLAPLAGAVVSAGPDFATATSAAGTYTLNVPWGSYYVAAQANGYTTEGRDLPVHANLTGVDFVLPQAAYTVSGVVKDGLTGNPLGNVYIYEGTQQLTQTGPDGSFSTPLPNGTTVLTAVATGTLASDYAAVNFSVAIEGSSVTRTVLMYPAPVQIYGLVVSGISGEPLANLTVVVNGSTIDGIPIHATYQTDSLGAYVAQVYVGHYTVSASSSGYQRSSTAVQAQPVTLSLTPISVAASEPLGVQSYTPFAALFAVAAVALAALLLLRRRRQR